VQLTAPFDVTGLPAQFRQVKDLLGACGAVEDEWRKDGRNEISISGLWRSGKEGLDSISTVSPLLSSVDAGTIGNVPRVPSCA